MLFTVLMHKAAAPFGTAGQQIKLNGCLKNLQLLSLVCAERKEQKDVWLMEAHSMAAVFRKQLRQIT